MVSKSIIDAKLKLFEIFKQSKFSNFSLIKIELKSFCPPPKHLAQALLFNKAIMVQRREVK